MLVLRDVFSDSRVGEDRFRSHIGRKALLTAVLTVLMVCLTASMAMAASKSDKDRHKIGPGDVLEISVWQDESLRREVIVPPDLVVSFPLVGDIDVTGMTVTDLRKILSEKLKEYVQDATVTVMYMRINSLSAYVIGKVNQPGQFPISMDTSVLQILAMAGGLNPFAASGDILIIRRQGKKTIKMPFDYNDVKRGKNLEQNIILQRGDVVVVP